MGPNRYRLIAGERRLRAAKLAEIPTVPIFIRDDLSEIESELLQLRENVQRESLTPVEEAKKLQRIKELTGRTWKQIAQDFGWSESTVKHKMGVLNAPERVQSLIGERAISPEHYRKMATLPEGIQVEWAERAAAEGMTVREFGEAVKSFPPEAPAEDPPGKIEEKGGVDSTPRAEPPRPRRAAASTPTSSGST